MERLSPSNPTHDDVEALVRTQDASVSNDAGNPESGRVSVVTNGDGPGVGVPLSLKGKGTAEHSSPFPNTVLVLSDDDMQALLEGRRLRGGNRYRSEGTVIDVRGIHKRIPEDSLPFAISQITRVGSQKGRAALLVHPGESWAFDDRNFCGLRMIRDERHPGGIVRVFSRVLNVHPSKEASSLRRSEPPDADCVVLRTRCRLDNARLWTVSMKINGRTFNDTIPVSCANPTIGRVEALASVLKPLSPESVVIPAEALLLQHLLSDTRVMQVALYDGLDALRQWSWSRVGEAWLVGRRT